MRLLEPHECQRQVNPSPLHVGIIMDGNGRWAKYRGLKRTEGHFAAWRAVISCIGAALDQKLETLTLYAFSPENWNRPPKDIEELFNIHRWKEGQRGFEGLADRGVRFVVLGDLEEERIPKSVKSWLTHLEKYSRSGARLSVYVALNDGGRQDLFRAARKAQDSQATMRDESDFRELLDHPELPDLDLVIRTGGECRISNFQLWRIAYSELLFTDTLFPDFTAGHFVSALNEYSSRRRRYGQISK